MSFLGALLGASRRLSAVTFIMWSELSFGMKSFIFLKRSTNQEAVIGQYGAKSGTKSGALYLFSIEFVSPNIYLMATSFWKTEPKLKI